MKTILFAGFLMGALGATRPVWAQARATEQQALMKQLDQLMQNPDKPKQHVHLALNGCHAEQIIRDRDADVQMAKPLAVSFNSGSSGWAMRMDDGFFELKMSFDWADVAPLTYALAKNDEDEPKHYEIKLIKRKKGSTVSFELPLYTSNEATVKDVVRRLEKVRQSCGDE